MRPAQRGTRLVGARDRPGVALGGAFLMTREDDTLVHLLAICLSPVKCLFTSFGSLCNWVTCLLTEPAEVFYIPDTSPGSRTLQALSRSMARFLISAF